MTKPLISSSDQDIVDAIDGSVIEDVSVGYEATGMTIHDGNMYMISSDQDTLYTIDMSNGIATKVCSNK